MTDGFKQHKDVSDQELRSYLLGELPEQERLVFDQRLLADDGFAQKVRVAESQLIDEYVAGEFDPRTAQAFQTAFLRTEARRKQLRLAESLRDYAVRTPAARPLSQVPKKQTWRERLAPFLTLPARSPWATAGAFALLILGITVIAYLGPRLPKTSVQVAQQPSPSMSASPDPVSSPAVAQVQAPASPTPQAKATPSEPPIAVASFVLMPGALRGYGEMARVAVPRGDRAVLRLSLILEEPGAGTYQAELANADGQTITVRKGLKPSRNGQTKIVVDLPARLVQSGDYQIKLGRQTDGGFESAGRYYFRALQE